jgi:hypothetical protein
LEYEIFDWSGKSKYWIDQHYIRFVLGVDPEFLLKKPILEKIWIAASVTPSSVLSGLFLWIKSSLKLCKNGNIDKPRFDEYGDSLFDGEKLDHRDRFRGQRNWVSEVFLYQFNATPKAAPALVNFLEWTNQKGVKVLATFPNLAKNTQYPIHRVQAVDSMIRTFYADLGVKVIGSSSEAMFPQDMYFDTNYHLMENGIYNRTILLIEKINTIGVEFGN